MFDLNQIGVPAGESPWRVNPEELYVTPTMELPEQEFLFEVRGVSCMPVGEVVTITGKAKQGKTFATSLTMAAAMGQGPVLGIRRLSDEPQRVLYIDTEQSRRSTQLVQRRVMAMIGCRREEYQQELFPTVNLRSLDWQERMRYVRHYIERHQPRLVVLDGCRDLVDDINDNALSSQVVTELMQLASGPHPCCILTVLHQNKAAEDNTLRGHLGTEITNKSFEVYVMQRSDAGIFTLHQECSREVALKQDILFLIDDFGLPVDSGSDSVPKTDDQTNSGNSPRDFSGCRPEHFRTPDGQYRLREIFEYLLPGRAMMQASPCRNLLSDFFGQSGGNVNTLIINPALKEHIICKLEGEYGRLFYSRIDLQLTMNSVD